MSDFSSQGHTPHSVIPVLTSWVSTSEISPELLAALDKQQAEKNTFFALADMLQASLRPELERLTLDVVQRTLQTAWAQRSAVIAERDKKHELS